MPFSPGCISCMGDKRMLKTLISVGILSTLVSGCATTNFAKSSTPATIQEEWTRSGMLTWGGTRIYAVGNIEFGFLQQENDSTFTVDPGEKTITVWYYANRGSMNGMFHQTNLVPLKTTLKPNGKYQVQGDYGEEFVRFRLVDLDTKQVLVQSADVPIILRPSPAPAQPTMIPIFVPGR